MIEFKYPSLDKSLTFVSFSRLFYNSLPTPFSVIYGYTDRFTPSSSPEDTFSLLLEREGLGLGVG